MPCLLRVTHLGTVHEALKVQLKEVFFANSTSATLAADAADITLC